MVVEGMYKISKPLHKILFLFYSFRCVFQLLMALHCKKRLAIFPSPAGMSLTQLSKARNVFFRSWSVGLVTSRQGRKIANLFYSVIIKM
jgi:hypothetical protein